MLKIYNDIIPKSSQKRLETIINGADFSWHILKNTAYQPNCAVPKFWSMSDTIGYVKTVYNEGTIYTKEMMPWCLHILDSVLDKENIEMKELIRIQINLLYQSVNPEYNENMWTSAHIDQEFDHKVLLYYINDTDGDTFLFNEKNGDIFDSFTIKDRVSPKQGKAILFDGNYFHAASNPININKRLAINFNFK